MKKMLFAVVCMCLILQCISSCKPDEDKNQSDIMLMWIGSEDLLKVTTPLVSWLKFPDNVDGEEIKTSIWKKDFHYENFDSILVYAVVTYPKPIQLPDTTGKEFVMYHQLTGGCIAFNDGGHKITTINPKEEVLDEKINGGQLEHYLDSINSIIHQYGFVVYRDGRAREKNKYEELNWEK